MSENYNIKIPSLTQFYRYTKRSKLDFSGVYVIEKDGEIVYIGQSTNLGTRLLGHQFVRKNKDFILDISYLRVDNDKERHFLEICYYYKFLRAKMTLKKNGGFRV